MKNTLQRKKQEGFTIIEVLIVLAIAGLIILIVFLAVPALQRNSRNTQRKNDVSALAGALQETINNSNGAAVTLATAVANGKISFYAPGDVTGQTDRAAAVGNVTPDSSTVQINNFSKCPASPFAAYPTPLNTAATATKRSLTAIYAVETSGGFQTQCQDL